MRRVILMLVDGLRPDVAETELGRGRLPHLAAMVGKGGAGRALTVFPSTTLVAYLPFLTGCTPGRCNIPSARWLDRRRYTGRWWRDRQFVRSYCGYQADQLDHDIAPQVRTVFQLVPESLGIFTPITRGLTPDRDPSRRLRKRLAGLGHYYLPAVQRADEAAGRALLDEADGNWRFIFAQFPAVDGFSHRLGHESLPVKRALHRIDGVVGVLRERLAAAGELRDTLILMVSDHGFADVHTHLDLGDWFRRQGVRTLTHPELWVCSPSAAVMVNGNGSAMVYARPGIARRRRLCLDELRQPEAFGAGRDLVGALVREPAVAFVAAAEGHAGVALLSADGQAVLRQRGRWLTYEPDAGDPLRLGGPRRATADQWLQAAATDHYPDAAVQLLGLFRADRTGDLVVVAQQGYDLRRRFEFPSMCAGHGSLERAHMQIPLWSSEPLPATTLRSVDVFPAMLDWLGVDVPFGIDGETTWRPGVQAPVERAS